MNPPIYEIAKSLKRENKALKALALALGILLSISVFISISQGSRLAKFQNSKELLFRTSPDEFESGQDILSKKNINLSDYVALNGFRGLPVIIMNNETPGYDEWNSDHPNSRATYSPKLDAIKLRDKPKSYTVTLKILQHEYGHHLWNKTITDKDRNEYRKIYAESPEFVTPYSLTATGEDFAESYAYYKLELPLPEARQTFMAKLEEKYEDF